MSNARSPGRLMLREGGDTECGKWDYIWVKHVGSGTIIAVNKCLKWDFPIHVNVRLAIFVEIICVFTTKLFR